MRKAITPVVSIVLLSLMTVGAAVLGFVWINAVQANVQETAGTSIADSTVSSSGQLQIISMRGDGVTIHNVGNGVIENISLLINDELTSYALDTPLNPGDATFISYSSLPLGETACVEVVLSSGQSVQKCVSSEDATNESGFGVVEEPIIEGCQEVEGDCTKVWFTGDVTSKDNSTCACCGDNGAGETFYNGTINNSTFFCQDGVYTNQEIDDNSTICNEWGNTWINGDLHYYGTYSFTSDEVGSVADGWTIGGYSVQVVDNIGGHSKVFELKGSGGEHSYSSQEYTGQVSGAIEFWIRTDNIVKRSQVDFRDDSLNEAFWFYLRESKFKYFDGSSAQVIPNVPDPQVNTWHHVVIYFECGNDGYRGLSADQAEFVIDGVSSGPVDFTYSVNNIGRTALYADPTASSTYWDAIGYSWDSDYNIGDNKLVHCCGDDATDNFFTGYVNNATEFCYNGAIFNQDVDSNQTLCEKWNNHWLVSDWWNSSFNNRKQFIVEEESGSTLTNYQVQIEPDTYNTNNLIASYHFSDNSAWTKDYSGNNNYGKLYGNTVALWHLDEGTWDDTYDASNNLLNGLLYNSPSWVKGVSSKAVYFDGVDDYISIPHNNAFNFGTHDVSISAWVKLNSTSGIRTIIGKSNTANPYQGFSLQVRDSNTVVFYVSDCGTGSCGWGTTRSYVESTTTVNDGEWHHVVGVRNSTGYTLYIDGAANNYRTESARNPDNTNNLYLGIQDGTSYKMNGTVDEVAIYNKSLTSSEVQELYNHKKAKFIEYKEGYNNKGVGLEFDGEDDYVTVPQLITSSPYTLTLWMKPSEVDVDRQGIMRIGDDGDQQLTISRNLNYLGKIRYHVGCTGYTNDMGSTNNATLDEWTFVALVIEADNDGLLYVNGILNDTATDVSSGNCNGNMYGTGEFRFGYGYNSYFNGSIDEVRLYNTALNANQILELYNESKGRYDYADLRFIDSNDNELDYFVEYDDNVFVNITNIPSADNATIYMYYNNINADEIMSNSTTTLFAYDDFNDNVLDSSKWMQSINSPSNDVYIKLTNGELNIRHYHTTCSGDSSWIGTHTPVSGDDVGLHLRTKTKYYQTSYDDGGTYNIITNITSLYQWGMHVFNGYEHYYCTTPKGTTNQYGSGLSNNVWYEMDLIRSAAGETKYVRGGSTRYTETTNSISLINPYIRLQHGRCTKGNAYWDWVIARKYASTEPTIYTGLEESYINPHTSCCGDDGALDNFSNSTNSCINGVFS